VAPLAFDALAIGACGACGAFGAVGAKGGNFRPKTTFL